MQTDIPKNVLFDSEDMMQLPSTSELMRFLLQLLEMAGLWKIFEKCGEKGWWALIPGVHYYKLGKCAGRETDGKLSLVMEIAVLVLSTADQFLPKDTRVENMAVVLQLVCLIMLIVFQIRVDAGICRTFGRTKWWLVLWIFASWIPSLLWGFSSKYQPVNLGRYNDDDHLPGSVPVDFGPPTAAQAAAAAAAAADPEKSGLLVRLRSRTVNDFMTKRYLLKDISIHIPNGSLVLLLGGSGSGKTTFVNAVTGYEKADATALLNGKDIYKDYGEMKYRIGFVPQQELLRMNDTVRGTLNDAASLRLPVEISQEQARRRVDEVVELLGLTSGQTGLVSKKSGGQKKRISIGMELISDPELFILDEPDSGLDGVIARELFEKLRKIADAGNIVIAITHTPDRVADLFDYVIVLAKDSGRVGRLAFYGTPDQARAFFGKKTMEEVVMSINRKEEGGEGRADEFVAAYAANGPDGPGPGPLAPEEPAAAEDAAEGTPGDAKDGKEADHEQ